MIVRDPLYGEFEIAGPVASLLATPEARRLTQIRLLNTYSPSLATLGDLRRYSHTLGVLYLSRLASRSGFGPSERMALEAAVVLHDIGTPPFGHLVEYVYRERGQKSHEDIIQAILRGAHVPENRAHQIFGSRPIRFMKDLQRLNFDVDLVERIVTREHPLSALLFGTIDLDNIDNVARMAMALGIAHGAQWAGVLASGLRVGVGGTLHVSESTGRALVEQWAELRRKSYEAIVFDADTVAAQAVLTAAIEKAMDAELLSVDDWFLTDEELLARLRKHPETKDLINREYLGELPPPLFCLHVRGSREEMGLRSRGEAIQAVARVLDSNSLAYVFEDRGTFGKRVELCDAGTGRTWHVGETSRSVVFYAFTRGRRPRSEEAGREACRTLVAHLGIGGDRILRAFGPSWSRDAVLSFD